MYAIDKQKTKYQFITVVSSNASGGRCSSKNSNRIVVLYLVGKTIYRLQ